MKKMRKKIYFSIILIFNFTAFCNAKSESLLLNEPGKYFNEKSVWKGNASICLDKKQPAECLIKEIKKDGTPEALHAAEYLSDIHVDGFVKSYFHFGSVGITEVTIPYRANANNEVFLIPSSGKIVNTSDIANDKLTETLWQEYKKTHPDSDIWLPAKLYSRKQTKDEINLTYSYPLKGCHSCENTGNIFISYVFSSDGVFIKKLVSFIQ